MGYIYISHRLKYFTPASPVRVSPKHLDVGLHPLQRHHLVLKAEVTGDDLIARTQEPCTQELQGQTFGQRRLTRQP